MLHELGKVFLEAVAGDDPETRRIVTGPLGIVSDIAEVAALGVLAAAPKR